MGGVNIYAGEVRKCKEEDVYYDLPFGYTASLTVREGLTVIKFDGGHNQFESTEAIRTANGFKLIIVGEWELADFFEGIKKMILSRKIVKPIPTEKEIPYNYPR